MSEAIVWFGSICGILALAMATWVVLRQPAMKLGGDDDDHTSANAWAAGAVIGTALYFGCIVLLVGQAIITVATR